MFKPIIRWWRARQRRIDERILFPSFHRVAFDPQYRSMLDSQGRTPQEAYDWMVAEHKRIDPAWRNDHDV